MAASSIDIWPEIDAIVEKGKRELRLNGQNVAKRIAESNGRLPERLWTLQSKLIKLEISGINSLQEIPSSIGNLISLKELILSENKLTRIPGGTFILLCVAIIIR